MFTKINLPYTKYIPFVETTNYYSIGIYDAKHWLEEFDLADVCEGRDIKCIIGWIAPQKRIPIHLDNGPEGLVQWALDFTSEEFKEVVLEMYDNLNIENKANRSLSPIYHNEYQIPVIEHYNSKLIESYKFTEGAVMFNPGKHWHSGYNPSNDKWMGIVSLRSWYAEDGMAIKEKLEKMGLIQCV